MKRCFARIFAKMVMLELAKHFAWIEIAGLSFGTPVTRMPKRNINLVKFGIQCHTVTECQLYIKHSLILQKKFHSRFILLNNNPYFENKSLKKLISSTKSNVYSLWARSSLDWLQAHNFAIALFTLAVVYLLAFNSSGFFNCNCMYKKEQI